MSGHDETNVGWFLLKLVVLEHVLNVFYLLVYLQLPPRAIFLMSVGCHVRLRFFFFT